MAKPAKASVALPGPPTILVKDESCATCRHFLPLGGVTGLCRRFPPSINLMSPTPHGPAMSFPVVTASMLCGEYSPR